MVAPFFLALTRTPSIGPSGSERTLPVRAGLCAWVQAGCTTAGDASRAIAITSTLNVLMGTSHLPIPGRPLRLKKPVEGQFSLIIFPKCASARHVGHSGRPTDSDGAVVAKRGAGSALGFRRPHNDVRGRCQGAPHTIAGSPQDAPARNTGRAACASPSRHQWTSPRARRALTFQTNHSRRSHTTAGSPQDAPARATQDAQPAHPGPRFQRAIHGTFRLPRSRTRCLVD